MNFQCGGCAVVIGDDGGDGIAFRVVKAFRQREKQCQFACDIPVLFPQQGAVGVIFKIPFGDAVVPAGDDGAKHLLRMGQAENLGV